MSPPSRPLRDRPIVGFWGSFFLLQGNPFFFTSRCLKNTGQSAFGYFSLGPRVLQLNARHAFQGASWRVQVFVPSIFPEGAPATAYPVSEWRLRHSVLCPFPFCLPLFSPVKFFPSPSTKHHALPPRSLPRSHWRRRLLDISNTTTRQRPLCLKDLAHA